MAVCLCQDFLCCIRRAREFTGQQSVSSLQETTKWGNEDILSINKTDRTCGDMMGLKIIVLLIFWWINCCAFFQISLILKFFLDICGAHLCTSKPLWSFSSVQFSCSVVSDSLWPHESQHARPPCPSPTPGVHSNSCPSSRWCHPSILSSVVPFSSCPQSFPASGSFQMSQLFTSGGQSIGVSASASVLPMNIQDWFPLGWTGWISLLSKDS